MEVGQSSAEADGQWLSECFEDNGYLAQLKDPESPKFLVVGRTGAGKTALLTLLEGQCSDTHRIRGEHLLLHELSTSTIVSMIRSNNLPLDPFFKAIWRHALTTELLKIKYPALGSENAWWRAIIDLARPDKRRALEYLQQLGASVFDDFEERVRKLTHHIEGQLSADAQGVGAKASAAKSRESEFQRSFTRLITSGTLSHLDSAAQFLDEAVFVDRKRTYYFLIDDLDKLILPDDLGPLFIRCLIDVVKSFRAVRRVKILISLRTDMMLEVFRGPKDRSFQREKYLDNILEVKWSSAQLVRALDRRVRLSFKRQYSNSIVTLSDILPARVGSSTAADYLLERTLMRPREAILFLNECLKVAENEASISARNMRAAEVKYSGDRVQSLVDEWGSRYPLLFEYFSPLYNKPYVLDLGDVTTAELEKLGLGLAQKVASNPDDPLVKAAIDWLSGDEPEHNEMRFRSEWLRAMYVIGVVGVKAQAHESVQWSFKNDYDIGSERMLAACRIEIHPAVRAYFGNVSPNSRRTLKSRDDGAGQRGDG